MAKVSRGEGAQPPDGLKWEEFDYAIVECPWEVRLVDLRKETVQPGDYHRGVLFGKEAELRWRKLRNGSFRWVLWREAGDTGEEAERLDEGQVILWGEPVGDAKPPTWWEPRIQRWIQEYPEKFEGKRVAMEVARYRVMAKRPVPGGKEEEGTVTLERYRGLVAVEEIQATEPVGEEA